MSNQITKAFVAQFRDNLISLSQQRGSRLSSHVRRQNLVGNIDHYERLGATEAVKRTSRHQDTPIIETPHSRRRVVVEDWVSADLIDKNDDVKILINPQSAYARNIASSLGRTMDDVIIAAAQGLSTAVGEGNGDGLCNETLIPVPASQIVDKDFKGVGSDATLSKLIEAKRILMSNDVDIHDGFFYVTDAEGLYGMLDDEERMTSADYNTVRTLVNGDIDTFMGFKFIQSERLLPNAAADSLNNLAFTGTAIGLSVARDIDLQIDRRPDKNNSQQVLAEMVIGSVRIEEEKLVLIEATRAGLTKGARKGKSQKRHDNTAVNDALREEVRAMRAELDSLKEAKEITETTSAKKKH